MNDKGEYSNWDSHHDVDAALKIILNTLVLDCRILELSEVFSPESPVVALEGEPGWELELLGKEPGLPIRLSSSMQACIEPEAYFLSFPQFVCSVSEFSQYLIEGLNSTRIPETAKEDIKKVLSCLQTLEA